MSDAAQDPVPAEPWEILRSLTPARVALGRTGASLPTREVLRFGYAHALARDAVHAGLDVAAIATELRAAGLPFTELTSAAEDRTTYLRRPDLGRRLTPEGRDRLAALGQPPCDVAIVIADGLSATAVHANAALLLAALLRGIAARGWSLAPVTIATQARVALGDEVGFLLKARLALVLIGERPGLSAPDSLGAYLTYAPRPGRRDHERNCVSNIRAAGLVPDRAADNILWLMGEAMRRGETGVALKDESQDIEVLPPIGTPSLP